MTQTYDLIVRGGEVANHAGRGMADVGVIDGRIAFIGDSLQVGGSGAPGDPSIYPSDEVKAKLYAISDLPPATQRILTRSWTKIKSGK